MTRDFNPDPYGVLSSTTAYEGERARVRVDEVSMPDGSRARREVVVVEDAVAVVALDEHRRVCLLEQYRHPLRRRLLELPAGKMDEEGESPLQTAQRELREEAALASRRWSELTSFENSAGWTTERTHVLLAEDVFAEQDEEFSASHEEADMGIAMVPFGKTLEMIDTSEITDAKTIVGLLLAGRRLGLG
jgi:8-oxo-dGTP pyrophosphatase MutT (NUDIX family)